MLKIFNIIKKHIVKIIELKNDPHSIALGFAVGTFIALLPTFGFGTFIGLLLLLIFENINKISLLSSFVIWNPLILAPIYFLGYKLGTIICGTVDSGQVSIKFKDLFYSYSTTFLIGNFIISLAISILSYILLIIIIKNFNKKDKNKNSKKNK